MTSEQRKQITELRSSGNSYGQIAKLLRLTKAQVSSYCRRKKLSVMENLHVWKTMRIPLSAEIVLILTLSVLLKFGNIKLDFQFN